MSQIVVVALVDLPRRRIAAGEVFTVGPLVARQLTKRGHVTPLADDSQTYSTRVLTPSPHVESTPARARRRRGSS